jgi:hypothetical protein
MFTFKKHNPPEDACQGIVGFGILGYSYYRIYFLRKTLLSVCFFIIVEVKTTKYRLY